MKCLLRYKWVKLPRDMLPPGNGIMGAWARLASRAAFRNGQAVYCGHINHVSVGEWAGGIVGLKNILKTNKRQRPGNGEQIYNVIYQTFITPDELSRANIMYRLNLSDRHYYRLRQQAVNILSIRLWTAPVGCLDAWLEVLTLLEET